MKQIRRRRVVTKLGPSFAFYSGDVIEQKQDKPGKITDMANSGVTNCENRTLEVVGSTPIGSTNIYSVKNSSVRGFCPWMEEFSLSLAICKSALPHFHGLYFFQNFSEKFFFVANLVFWSRNSISRM
jgi:hypothetical protein